MLYICRGASLTSSAGRRYWYSRVASSLVEEDLAGLQAGGYGLSVIDEQFGHTSGVVSAEVKIRRLPAIWFCVTQPCLSILWVRGRTVTSTCIGSGRSSLGTGFLRAACEGRREVIGVAKGMREDSASWEQFFRSMIERGLKGVRLVAGDRCAGLVAIVGSMLPKARYQRCMVHFMCNVLSKVPPVHREWASAALKAIFAMESRESALTKAEEVAAETESRKLKAAANCLWESIEETTTYLLAEFPNGYRRFIRTNNMIERMNREIRRRTHVVGSFPDGDSALMLIAPESATSPPMNGAHTATSTCRLDDNLRATN